MNPPVLPEKEKSMDKMREFIKVEVYSSDERCGLVAAERSRIIYFKYFDFVKYVPIQLGRIFYGKFSVVPENRCAKLKHMKPQGPPLGKNIGFQLPTAGFFGKNRHFYAEPLIFFMLCPIP